MLSIPTRLRLARTRSDRALSVAFCRTARLHMRSNTNTNTYTYMCTVIGIEHRGGETLSSPSKRCPYDAGERRPGPSESGTTFKMMLRAQSIICEPRPTSEARSHPRICASCAKYFPTRNRPHAPNREWSVAAKSCFVREVFFRMHGPRAPDRTGLANQNFASCAK